MPTDTTIQTALIVIAIAVSLQTVLMFCTVIAMALAWRRTTTMVEDRLGAFTARMDDVATQARIAVSALERSATQVNSVVHDASNVVRTVATAITAPRNLLVAGAASAASAFARWRRSRHQGPREVSASAR